MYSLYYYTLFEENLCFRIRWEQILIGPDIAFKITIF